ALTTTTLATLAPAISKVTTTLRRRTMKPLTRTMSPLTTLGLAGKAATMTVKTTDLAGTLMRRRMTVSLLLMMMPSAMTMRTMTVTLAAQLAGWLGTTTQRRTRATWRQTAALR